jgi:hypothetical protein
LSVCRDRARGRIRVGSRRGNRLSRFDGSGRRNNGGSSLRCSGRGLFFGSARDGSNGGGSVRLGSIFLDNLGGSGRAGGTEVSRTSVGLDVGSNFSCGEGLNEGTLDGAEGSENAVCLEGCELAGRRVDRVGYAGTAEGAGASRGGRLVGDSVQDLGLGGLVGCGLVDGLEGVAFDESGGAVVGIESVAVHVGEVVVDSVERSL